jgi:mono/diheme cytochrome c family protein
MHRRWAGLLLILVLLVAVGIRLAAADDPLVAKMVGTWTLNLAKSTFNPGPAPKGATLKFEASGDGVKQSNNNLDAQGNPISYTATYNFDGTEVPVTGDPSRDTTAWTRTDASTLTGTNRKAGKITTTQKRAFSADGKTFTLTTTGTNAQGQTVNNVEVFEKQTLSSDAAGASGNSAVAQGKALFASYTCGDCHGMNGEGTESAPDLTGTKLSPDEISAFIQKPDPDARGAGMPSVPATSPDLAPLVAYVVSLKRAQ